MLLAQARRGYIGHSSEAKPRNTFRGRTAGKWVTKGRPKVDISLSAENESSAESRLWVSAETENSPKVNCHFRPKAETETESDGV